MTEAQQSKGTLKATLITLTALVTLAGAVLAFGRDVLLPKPAPSPSIPQTSITVSPVITNTMQVTTAVEPLGAANQKATDPSPSGADAPSPPEPAVPTDGQKPACLGLQPELNVQKATVRYLLERHGQRSYGFTLVVSSTGDSPVSVSYVGRPSLTDDTGRMLSDAREGFPSGANVSLRKAEYLFNLGLKVGSEQPQALGYRFVRASQRGKTASFSGNLVLAQQLPDGNFTALSRTVTCENLAVE